MSRIMLISSLAVLLAASTHSANAIQSANQDASLLYSLACADVGIDPGSATFHQCVADLHHSLWAVENLYQS